MPVEFIGMISTRDQSETRRASGPVIDREYLRRFARAHEDAGFDQVLIGYSSSQPDGTQVAAYAASQTDRLGFLIAHRPGFVFPDVGGPHLRDPRSISRVGASLFTSLPAAATASNAATGTSSTRTAATPGPTSTSTS